MVLRTLIFSHNGLDCKYSMGIIRKRSKLGKIGQNWGKLGKIGENWGKFDLPDEIDHVYKTDSGLFGLDTANVKKKRTGATSTPVLVN